MLRLNWIPRVQWPKSLPALLWQWWEGVAFFHSDSTRFCSASWKSALTSDLSTKPSYLGAAHACEGASRQDESAVQDRGQMRVCTYKASNVCSAKDFKFILWDSDCLWPFCCLNFLFCLVLKFLFFFIPLSVRHLPLITFAKYQKP